MTILKMESHRVKILKCTGINISFYLQLFIKYTRLPVADYYRLVMHF